MDRNFIVILLSNITLLNQKSSIDQNYITHLAKLEKKDNTKGKERGGKKTHLSVIKDIFANKKNT